MFLVFLHPKIITTRDRSQKSKVNYQNVIQISVKLISPFRKTTPDEVKWRGGDTEGRKVKCLVTPQKKYIPAPQSVLKKKNIKKL